MLATKRLRKAKSKQKRVLLPRVKWTESEPTAHGNRLWVSRDGMFMLVCSEQFDGIVLPRLWVLWQWIRGGWTKVGERRGRVAIEKIARKRAAQLEESEE